LLLAAAATTAPAATTTAALSARFIGVGWFSSSARFVPRAHFFRRHVDVGAERIDGSVDFVINVGPFVDVMMIVVIAFFAGLGTQLVLFRSIDGAAAVSGGGFRRRRRRGLFVEEPFAESIVVGLRSPIDAALRLRGRLVVEEPFAESTVVGVVGGQRLAFRFARRLGFGRPHWSCSSRRFSMRPFPMRLVDDRLGGRLDVRDKIRRLVVELQVLEFRQRV
jgi:hypothetical protein